MISIDAKQFTSLRVYISNESVSFFTGEASDHGKCTVSGVKNINTHITEKYPKAIVTIGVATLQNAKLRYHARIHKKLRITQVRCMKLQTAKVLQDTELGRLSL
jgi:hypothetical protein